MKLFLKRHFMVLFIACVLISLVVTAEAHSGKTDGAGGHYNHSTGEYHYHHGYSAHQHYDMDEDGDADCPYTFKGKTNYDDTSSEHRNDTDHNFNSDNSTIAFTKDDSNEETPYMQTWLIMVIVVLSVTIVVLFFNILSKNKKIDEYRLETLDAKNKLQDLEKTNTERRINCATPYLKEVNSLKSQIASLNSQLKISNSKLEQEQLKIQNMKKAPNGITFAEDGMPIFWKKTDDKPYGDYTVFYSSKSNIYHVDKYCGSYSAKREHIFNVVNVGTPCKKCAKDFFDFTSVPEWFTIEQNKK